MPNTPPGTTTDAALREAIFDGIANLSSFAALDTPQGDLAAANLDTGEVWLITIQQAKLEVSDGE